MFYCKKDLLLSAIIKMRRDRCCYDMGCGREPSFCDCKYGYGNKDVLVNNEVTGCPELRVLEQLIKNMTDEEYKFLLGRKNERPSTSEALPDNFEYLVERLKKSEWEAACLAASEKMAVDAVHRMQILVNDFYKKAAEAKKNVKPEC